MLALAVPLAACSSTPPAPTPPTANAGMDQTAAPGDLVTLDGTASTGRALRHAWRQTAGTPPVDLGGSAAAIATFTAPFVSARTELTFELAVTDEAGATATDLAVVAVVPPPPHAIGHAQATFSGSLGSSEPIPVHLYYPAVAAGEDVAVAAGVFPVLVFGHGYQQSYLDYQYVWEKAVPAGYVVVLPDLLSSSATIDIDDYALDLGFLLRRVRELGADASSRFHGHVATTAAFMGHSTGGGASFLAAANAATNGTAQASAILVVAPLGRTTIVGPILGTSPKDQASKVTIPSLIVSGEEDCICPIATDAGALYEKLPLTATKVHLAVRRGDHCGMSDARGPGRLKCETGEAAACLALQGPTMEVADQNQLVASFLLPWLDAKVKGRGEAWGTFQVVIDDPRVSVQQHVR